MGADEHRVPVAPKDLADLAVLVNSGSLTTEIDLLVDDPDLAV